VVVVAARSRSLAWCGMADRRVVGLTADMCPVLVLMYLQVLTGTWKVRYD
jgi:hypothetical protein